MKKVLYTAFAVTQLCILVLCSQSLTAAGQTTGRRIAFSKLSDYVSDSDKRRDGERLIVTNVPVFSTVTYEKSYKMYYFKPDEAGDVGNSFYTSPVLAKGMRPLLRTDTASIRIECTLIQFADQFEVYRSPFATKVEGFDENGKLVWTISGPPPLKLKVRQ